MWGRQDLLRNEFSCDLDLKRFMEDMELDLRFSRGEIHGLLGGHWNDAAGSGHCTCEGLAVNENRDLNK